MPQYVDPVVSRSKLEREIAEYRAQERDYTARGWWLVYAEFPKVMVRMAAPQVNPPLVAIGVLLDYTNYDAEPPSVRLVHPFTEQPLVLAQISAPLRLHHVSTDIVAQDQQGIQLNVTQQPYVQGAEDEVPFICARGIKEYHDHPGHSGDDWELYRLSGEGRLVSILNLVYDHGIRHIGGYRLELVRRVPISVPQPT